MSKESGILRPLFRPSPARAALDARDAERRALLARDLADEARDAMAATRRAAELAGELEDAGVDCGQARTLLVLAAVHAELANGYVGLVADQAERESNT